MKWRQSLQEILHFYEILTIYGIQVSGQKKKIFLSLSFSKRCERNFSSKFAYSNILYLFQVLITRYPKRSNVALTCELLRGSPLLQRPDSTIEAVLVQSQFCPRCTNGVPLYQNAVVSYSLLCNLCNISYISGAFSGT